MASRAETLARLVRGITTDSKDVKNHVNDLCRAVEGALYHLPPGVRTVAQQSLHDLREVATDWVGRAERVVTVLKAPLPDAAALKREIPAAADAQAASTLVHSESSRHGPKMCKMLIVEDSSFQAMTILALAEECGYSARCVDSAEEAMDVLKNDEDVNLVLTDVMMEGVDGYQLLMRIRRECPTHIAVVMVSAHESLGLVEQCVAQGADAYLLKPMRMLELKSLWQYVWRRRHQAVLQSTVPAELLGGSSTPVASKPKSQETRKPLLRPDETQRAAAQHLDIFTDHAASLLQSTGKSVEIALTDIDRAMSKLEPSSAHENGATSSGVTHAAAPRAHAHARALTTRAAGESVHHAPARAEAEAWVSEDAPGEGETTVCKICERRIASAGLMKHVIRCSAEHQCAERLDELHSAMRKMSGTISEHHSKLTGALDELQCQVDALDVLKSSLVHAAKVQVHTSAEGPQGGAEQVEMVIAKAEERLATMSVALANLSAPMTLLWERVRRQLRNKVAIYFDMMAVEDPHGNRGGGARKAVSSEAASGARKRVSMRDFDVVDVLGSGGYGTVYLARRRSTRDLVAVKALTKAHLRATNALANVQLERLILSSVQSPYVVELFFSFASRNNVYMVMEYIPRGDCHDLLKQLGFFEEDLATFYLAEASEGLAYLHSQGVIMRDLKPQNMLIGADGHLKLTDFGLSAAYHGAELDAAPERAASASVVGENPVKKASKADLQADGTHNVGMDGGSRMASGWFGGGQCVGTPNYLAPEVLLHRRVTYALDVWSLGVVMYEFLVGEPPFDGETPEAIFENIVARRINLSIVNLLSKPAASLLRQLLIADETARPDIQSVKQHPFFREVDWACLREVEPLIKPNMRFPDPTKVDVRCNGAELDPTGSGTDEDDADFTSFASKNVRKLALMHLQRESPTNRRHNAPGARPDTAPARRLWQDEQRPETAPPLPQRRSRSPPQREAYSMREDYSNQELESSDEERDALPDLRQAKERISIASVTQSDVSDDDGPAWVNMGVVSTKS